jgi:hypothetical protein
MRRALQLQEALGGNSKTSLLVAASPHLDNIEETISTLKFAQRAKTIKNRVVVNEEKSVAELNAIINQLKKENEGLQKYALGLEGARRDAGVDPSTIVIPDTVGTVSAGGAAGGGGGDAVENAGFQAQIEKLNEMLRIAKEDAEQARKEAQEAAAGIEGAYAEGRDAMEQIQVLTKQRENERVIVKKAMSELKKLQGQQGEKDAMIQKAVTKMKEIQGGAIAAKKAQSEAEQSSAKLLDERTQLESKVKSLEAKVKLMQSVQKISRSKSGRMTVGDVVMEASSAAAAVDHQKVEVEKLQEAVALAGDEKTRAAAEAALEAANTVLQKAETAAAATPSETPAEPSSPTSDTDEGAEGGASEMLQRLDEQQKELEEAQRQLMEVKEAERKAIGEVESAAAAAEALNAELEDVRKEVEAAQQAKVEADQAAAEEAAKMESTLTDERGERSRVALSLDQANEMIEQKQGVITDLQASMARQEGQRAGGTGVVKTVGQATAVPDAASFSQPEDAFSMSPMNGGGGGNPQGANFKKSGRRKSFFSKGSSLTGFDEKGSKGAGSSMASAMKKLVGIEDTSEEQIRPTAMEPMPSLLTVMTQDGFRAKGWTDGQTALELPIGNADLLAEANAMDSYLDGMHHNLQCLANDYNHYVEAVSDMATAADALGTTVFAFAGVSGPAKLFFRLITAQTAGAKAQLDTTQRMLEAAIEGFWKSADAQAWKTDSLLKMMQEACTMLNVNTAKALASNSKEQYEVAQAEMRKAQATYGVKRWDYTTAIEALAIARTFDMNQLFSDVLHAQLESASAQHDAGTQLGDAIGAMKKDMSGTGLLTQGGERGPPGPRRLAMPTRRTLQLHPITWKLRTHAPMAERELSPQVGQDGRADQADEPAADVPHPALPDLLEPEVPDAGGEVLPDARRGPAHDVPPPPPGVGGQGREEGRSQARCASRLAAPVDSHGGHRCDPQGVLRCADVWLPVWGTVEFASATFSFNAEYMGPVPGGAGPRGLRIPRGGCALKYRCAVR